MSNACHMAFDQTLIVALVIACFVFGIAAVLYVTRVFVLDRKLGRIMAALKLDPLADELDVVGKWFGRS